MNPFLRPLLTLAGCAALVMLASCSKTPDAEVPAVPASGALSGDVCGLLEGMGVRAIQQEGDVFNIKFSDSTRKELQLERGLRKGLPCVTVRYATENAARDSLVTYVYKAESGTFLSAKRIGRTYKEEPFSDDSFGSLLTAADSVSVVYGSHTSFSDSPEVGFVFAQLLLADKLTIGYRPHPNPADPTARNSYLASYFVSDTVRQRAFLNKGLGVLNRQRGARYYYRDIVRLPWGVIAYATEPGR